MGNGCRVISCTLLLATAAVWWLPPGAWGCPFCDAPTTTLGEQLNTAHVAVLAKWVSAVKPDPQTFAEGTTTYEVLAAAGTAAQQYTVGTRFVVPRYNSGAVGEECLMFGALDGELVAWGLPSPVSRECWKYLTEAPSRELPLPERLPYFLAHLEHADPDIAMDAYGEFAAAPYEDLQAIAGKLPRDRVMVWLTDPLTVPTRKGLFGLMLGLCGNPAEAKFMEAILKEQPEDSRMGIDGMMAGYMLLTGNAGLQQLTVWKLQDAKTPDHEVYALLKALEFMWSYGRDRIDAAALKTTLRQLVQHPQLSGLVILDLARWQDWEMMDQLAAGYGTEPFADSHPRQCIVRFLIVAEKDAPAEVVPGSADYRAKAREHLARIRQTDPAVVKYVERYPFD